jgi:hypothetical protein
MFIISNDQTNSIFAEHYANLFKNIKIVNSPIQKLLVREIMKEDGFMFID